MDTEQVILVDEKDRSIGVAKKMEAHQKGLLHRAFSIFIFNTKGEMLLQQRALHKYHSGGLWTNACCSHPNPGEELLAAVKRRLKEEIGIEAPVEKVFDLIYKTELDNGLTENEFDHVFAGEYDGQVEINKNEVMDFCFKDIQAIRDSLQISPGKYTAWFHLAFPGIEEWWNRRYKDNMA
jgi:isopentenyl-diphosphate delta-isomerase